MGERSRRFGSSVVAVALVAALLVVAPAAVEVAPASAATVPTDGYAQVVASQGAVAHWRLGPPDTGVKNQQAHNAVSGSPDLLYGNTGTWALGATNDGDGTHLRAGQGASLRTSSSTDISGLVPTSDDYSASLWVRPNGQQTGQGLLLEHRRLSLRLDCAGVVHAVFEHEKYDDRPEFQTCTTSGVGTSERTEHLAGGALAPGEWHQVGFVFQVGLAQVVVDGEVVADLELTGDDACP